MEKIQRASRKIVFKISQNTSYIRDSENYVVQCGARNRRLWEIEYWATTAKAWASSAKIEDFTLANILGRLRKLDVFSFNPNAFNGSEFESQRIKEKCIKIPSENIFVVYWI